MKAKSAQYTKLDSEKICGTSETLQKRIADRFPKSGLAQVAAEMTALARATSAKVEKIARPNWPLRFQVGLAILAVVGLLAILVIRALELEASNELLTLMQGLDAAVNLLIVLGAGGLFLVTLERRIRRERALAGLHEFRSIVHVIDMHQLTKDPSAYGAPRTSSSPDRSMSAFELLRYLNYCTELLSLAGKVAALYAEKVSDSVVIEAVGDIERLTTNLSQKIWQKISMVERRMPGRPPSDELGP